MNFRCFVTLVSSPSALTFSSTLGAVRALGRFAGLLLMLAPFVVSAPADAQQTGWWEGISPDFSGRSSSPPPPAKADSLNDLRPNEVPWRSDEMLQAIDRAIDRYQEIVSRGGWPQVPPTRMMRVGEEDERVPMLRRRLAASGELRAKSLSGDYMFDPQLEAAVVRYQEANGLRASGRVDKPTLAALNVSADDRLQQLKTNRARVVELMQAPPEERYVLVNVPAFQLEAVERYTTILRHRVIVGRVGRDTPTLKATIRALNFFPYWHVPDSVAQLDLIPRLRKEPEYLDKEKIRVMLGSFDGQQLDPASIDWNTAEASRIKFRQDPGPQNALGLVRIDMQNQHGVYMHDTPMKDLFNQRARPFSAGCVRVQDVFQLVEWLARFEPGWEQRGACVTCSIRARRWMCSCRGRCLSISPISRRGPSPMASCSSAPTSTIATAARQTPWMTPKRRGLRRAWRLSFRSRACSTLSAWRLLDCASHADMASAHARAADDGRVALLPVAVGDDWRLRDA